MLLTQPTSGRDFNPTYDVVAEARNDLEAGSEMGSDKSPELKALMVSANKGDSSNLIPLHLARGNPLKHSVPAGNQITYNDISAPENSILWDLRRKQDALFFNCQS